MTLLCGVFRGPQANGILDGCGWPSVSEKSRLLDRPVSRGMNVVSCHPLLLWFTGCTGRSNFEWGNRQIPSSSAMGIWLVAPPLANQSDLANDTSFSTFNVTLACQFVCR